MKKLIFIFVIFLGIFFYLVLTSKIPFISQEIRESYTAYSLIHTLRDTNGKILPVLFKADGNYLSTFGVYLRVPTIYIFGPNSLGVRFSGAFAGIFCIIAFYFFLKEFIKDERYFFWSVLFFSLNPLFIKSAFVNPAALIDLAIVLLLIYFFLKLKNAQRKNFFKIALILLGIVFILILKFDPSYVRFLKSQTVISDLVPSAYSIQIDTRLSFDLTYGSPLSSGKINLNRIVFNKIFYFTNAVFKSIIEPFNFERLFSPFQSQTLLVVDGFNSKDLPSFYFWELPLIIAGYIVLSKKQNHIIYFLVGGIFIEIIFKESLLFLLPLTSVCESAFLLFLLKRYASFKWLIYFMAFAFLTMSTLILLDLIKNHSEDWIPDNDLHQSQIWENINSNDLGNDKIFVTDRMGEPVFYFLFYEKIDPQYFIENRVMGPILNGQIQRIDSVGNVTFESFEFNNIQHGLNEIWVGLGGEFVGQNLDYGNINSIANGQIIKKITEVNSGSRKFFGDEIWFVKTSVE